MSGFVCPNCKCETTLFSATSGGAQKMCEEFKCKLLSKIPLDPKIQSLIDKGESIFESEEESPVVTEYKKIQNELESLFKAWWYGYVIIQRTSPALCLRGSCRFHGWNELVEIRWWIFRWAFDILHRIFSIHFLIPDIISIFPYTTA